MNTGTGAGFGFVPISTRGLALAFCFLLLAPDEMLDLGRFHYRYLEVGRLEHFFIYCVTKEPKRERTTSRK